MIFNTAKSGGGTAKVTLPNYSSNVGAYYIDADGNAVKKDSMPGGTYVMQCPGILGLSSNYPANCSGGIQVLETGGSGGTRTYTSICLVTGDGTILFDGSSSSGGGSS